MTHQARCNVTGYIAGHYATHERAQQECDRLNAGLPLHRFVVVDTGGLA